MYENARGIAHFGRSRHGFDRSGVEVVGIDITTDMANAAVVAHLVADRQHSGDQNPHAAVANAAGDRRCLLERLAR